MRAGKKSANTRNERDFLASQEISEDLHDVWEMVRWNMPIEGRRRAEVFSEWAEQHPDEIAAMRGKSEIRRQKAFDRLEKHCVQVAEKARADLAGKNWDTFAAFEPIIEEELEDCAENTGRSEYAAAQLEMLLRERATGAPF